MKYQPDLTVADSVPIKGTGLYYDGALNQRGWCSAFSNPTGLIPAIAQGVGPADRVGNRITPKNMYVKYNIYALPTTDASSMANTNPYKGIPFHVRVIVFRHRYADDDGSQTNILKVGNTNVSLGSSVDNLFKPYNKDEYIILHSATYKMAACRHVTGGTNGTVTTENTPMGCKTFVHRAAKIKLPKVLKYDTNGQHPTNQSFYLAACVINEDSSADSAGTYTRALLMAESSISYYDV